MGAVTGSLQRPEVLVMGRYRGKELEVVGRTVKLTDDQSASIAKLLKPAGVRHPWPDQISTHWGRGSKTPLVQGPVEGGGRGAADAALQAGHYRHPALGPTSHRPHPGRRRNPPGRLIQLRGAPQRAVRPAPRHLLPQLFCGVGRQRSVDGLTEFVGSIVARSRRTVDLAG